MISTVAPESTTAALAASAPIEKKEESHIPGTFPVTPAALDKEISVNPLPATDGAVNPIKLAPGEKIPPALVGESTTGNVKLDKESYEKADTLPGVESLPPVTKNMIPESSLPIAEGDSTILSSVGPSATTVGLAAGAPILTKKDKVPEVVKESQEEAGAPPEASAVPEEVKEKADVEAELLSKVTTAPTTSEGTSGVGTTKTEGTVLGAVGGAVTALGAAAMATAVAAKDSVVASMPDSVKSALPEAVVAPAAPAAKEKAIETISPEVPAEVKESIVEAGTSAEAAGNTEAVEEKKTVEAELLKEVKKVEPEPEPANGESSKPAEANGTEVAAAEPAEASTSKAVETPESPATTTEKKKKNRLSTFISKLKNKVKN